MKGFASAALVAALTLMTSHATAAPYGTAGCGLGSMAFGPKPGMIQVLAATVNATGMQTIGITFGTSNCGDKMAAGGEMDELPGEKPEAPHKKKKKKSTGSVQEQSDFIANNINALKRDVAQGYGDSLAGLAATLGCEVKVYPQFTHRLQAAQSEIFATDDVAQVLAGIKSHLQAEPALSDSCDLGANDIASSH